MELQKELQYREIVLCQSWGWVACLLALKIIIQNSVFYLLATSTSRKYMSCLPQLPQQMLLSLFVYFVLKLSNFLSPYLILCFVLCFYISKVDVSFFFSLSKNCVYYYYHYYSSSTSFKHNFLMGVIRGQMTSPLTTTVFLQYSICYLEGCVVCIDLIVMWRILYSFSYHHHHSSSIINKFQVAS